MKNKNILVIMSLILFLFNHSIALAQDQLTNVEIERYLSSITSLQLLDTQIEAESENDDQVVESQFFEETGTMSLTPITDSLSKITTHPTYDRFTEIIKRTGFSSPQQWASAGDRIMIAYSAYQLKNPPQNNGANMGAITDEMQASLERIEKNQFISSEQKQILKNKIKNSMALMSDPNYIENENIPIISPYIARLNSLFKDYQ